MTKGKWRELIKALGEERERGSEKKGGWEREGRR